MVRHRILVVDDDPLIRGSLYEMLRGQRYEVEIASDGAEALDHLKRRSFHLVFTDWKMPQVDGLSLLQHIKLHHPGVLVVLITGFGTISSAVEAIRHGAFDYLTKPIQAEELEATIQRAFLHLAPSSSASDASDDPFAGIIGNDPAMQKLFEMIRAVANSPATVLLEGESGTGKRLIAQAIHRADAKRRSHPFVEISCGALPETLLESELFGHVRGSFTGAIRDKQGRFELADGGTILLDEIDAFTPALQVKLLRALQERTFERVGDTRTIKIDVRIVAATNHRLLDLVKQGKFREDLYYRLNGITMTLPPLRQRKGDLPLLVDYFLTRSAATMGKTITAFSPEARALLARYDWPGNVRELEHIIERAVILAKHPTITADDLPESVRTPTDLPSVEAQNGQSSLNGAAASPNAAEAALKEALKIPERELILKTLEEVRWNRSEAARRLGVHRSTLYQKIRQLGILRTS